jgi:hypothetical protein
MDCVLLSQLPVAATFFDFEVALAEGDFALGPGFAEGAFLLGGCVVDGSVIAA